MDPSSPRPTVEAGSLAPAEAVLREVAAGLAALARDPTWSLAIDLHSLPLDKLDREWLRVQLGEGEVEARLEIGGASRVRETSYAGVWWVTHCGGDGVPFVEQIEVATVPAVLCAHPDSVARARERLARELDRRGHVADPGLLQET